LPRVTISAKRKRLSITSLSPPAATVRCSATDELRCLRLGIRTFPRQQGPLDIFPPDSFLRFPGQHINGLTENAGHENTGHEFARHDKYRMKIDYITLECAFLLNFECFVCKASVLTYKKLTALAHHKYSSVL